MKQYIGYTIEKQRSDRKRIIFKIVLVSIPIFLGLLTTLFSVVVGLCFIVPFAFFLFMYIKNLKEIKEYASRTPILPERIENFTEKQNKVELLHRVALMACFLLTIIYAYYLYQEDMSYISLLYPGLITFFNILFYFIFSFRNRVKLNKISIKSRLLVEDIDFSRYTLPRAKIYCGEHAFVRKQFFSVVPYTEIIWIYAKSQMTGGFGVSKSVVLRLRDGGKCEIDADSDEALWIFENIVDYNNPDLIVGFGIEQEQLYELTYNRGYYNAKKVWGIILLSVGTVLLIVSLILKTIFTPGVFIIISALMSGIILLFKSRELK